jgi:diadenylate cyclase
MVLRLNTMQWLIEMLFPGLIIALAIIFQPELRKIFTRLGQGKLFRLAPGVQRSHIDSIINSVEVLSMRHVGSLIVLCRQVGLKNVIETGTTVNAALSSSLILTIFSEGSPLHDGAIVIKGDIMEAVGCFLPLSDQTDIKRSFGTRHRAALGLAEESDAVIIVVSEETGAISLAYDAQLHYDIPAELVRRRLHQLFDIHGEEEKSIAEDTGA